MFMATYLCRWPNGEFSIVNARNKADAIERLDEWGNAEQAILTRMTECMIDFRLSNEGQIELADVGELTHDFIMEACYPKLRDAFSTAESDEGGMGYSGEGLQRIREAVELERTRLWESQPAPKQPATLLGRDIQKQTGAPSVMVNRIVKEAVRKRLRSKEGEGNRPN